MERLARARQVLEMEARAIAALVPTLGQEFERSLDLILGHQGRVVVSGIGKSGLIGVKISATLASTGTPSFFLHPAEAIHGDLGRVVKEDVAILISNSGETGEVLRLIDPLRKIGTDLIAMTGQPESALARSADIVLDCGRAPEACPLGLAPTTSTAAILALGDALAMSLLDARRFETEDYARFHPGGTLGRKLMRVSEIMRRGEAMTVVAMDLPAREVLIAMNSTRGRPGAAMIIDQSQRLVGFFTDGDLARNLQAGLDFLHRPIAQVMISNPITISPEKLASEAWHLLQERQIDQLPVVSPTGVPLGLLDVQDLLSAKVY